MLILTRRVGESLMIGDEVNVTVLRNTRQSGANWRECAKGSIRAS